MPYPKSPFNDDFNANILFQLKGDDETSVNEIQTDHLEILEWLCKAPEITTFRVNTLKCTPGDVRKYIQTHVQNALGVDTPVTVENDSQCDDAIIIHHPNVNKPKLEIYNKEIIVDSLCAAAVLRGAHIYAPGVMAMMSGTRIDDYVSVYADIARKCKKGLSKLYSNQKIFIANGIVKMGRNQLFCETPSTGLAIQIIETISQCPSLLGDDFLPPGSALLQNLPSIICIHVLNPRPDEVILDMCASPGNKTTHIAALMQNRGKLIAVDKTPAKIAQLRKTCDHFGAQVEIIQADSTKLVQDSKFAPNSFDKILLDAPCSALGRRPQLLNTITPKVLRSYVPLQRKLFKNAVQLLKSGGVLVYSTCTVTLGENEGIVEWALENFNLELKEATPILGGSGLRGTKLNDDHLNKLQRFGPNQSIDSVGFFIAKFTKINK